AAASVKIPKEGSLEQLAVNSVGEIARAAGRIERVRGAIQRGAMLADEMFPGGLITFGAAARQCEILEVQRGDISAAPGRSFERLGKSVARHAPAGGVCTAIETLDELRVDRQPSHSTPA